MVSPDGRLLLGADLRAAHVTVHALTADYPWPGVAIHQRIAAIPIARNPSRMVADWTTGRLYVGTVADMAISVVDVNPASPTFLQEVERVRTTVGTEVPQSTSGNIAGIRSLALSSDGRYLYAARGGPPFLLVFDTTGAMQAPLTCASIPGGNPGPAPLTVDSLAFSPDNSQLFFSANRDAFVRVLSVRPGEFPDEMIETIPTGSPTSRGIAVHSDGRVFVSNPSRGEIIVADPNVTPGTSPLQFIPGIAGRPAISPDGNYLFVAGSSVATVDIRQSVNGQANPLKYKILARTVGAASSTSVAVSPGLLTPAGTGVTVTPLPGVSITFPEVTTEGHTTVTAANVSDVPVASGFHLDPIPVFYEIKTSAEWMAGGPATVCLTYNDEGLTPEDEQRLRLLHEENGVAVDRTVSRDIGANVICAEVSSFSQVVPASVVVRAPVVTWSAPASIAYGTALDASQLNATADVDGWFSYDPPAGTVLAAGTHTLTAHFTPSDTAAYTSANASLSITVVPAASPISWSPPSPIAEGTPLTAVQLNATSAVPGTFTYAPPGGTLLDSGDHVLAVSFAPDDAANYLSATAAVSITVMPTPGRMTGDGFTDTADGRYHFEFQVRERASGAEAGTLQLRRDRKQGKKPMHDRFVSTSVDGVIFSDDPRTEPGRHGRPVVDSVIFQGTGRWNGNDGYTFTARAVDAGEPGRGRDEVTVTIVAPDGSIALTIGGTIDGGNVQSTRLR